MDFYHETINSEAFAHSSNLQCIVWGCGWAWGRDFLQRELSFHLADLQNRREYLYDKAKNRDFCLLIAAWLMQIPSKTSHIFIKRHFGPWSNYRVVVFKKLLTNWQLIILILGIIVHIITWTEGFVVICRSASAFQTLPSNKLYNNRPIVYIYHCLHCLHCLHYFHRSKCLHCLNCLNLNYLS